MDTLVELFRYNAWANCRILDACAALPIEGQPTERRPLPTVDLARETCLATDAACVRLVAGLDDADLARTFYMPGLKRDLTVRQALIQVALQLDRAPRRPRRHHAPGRHAAAARLRPVPRHRARRCR